MAGIDFSRGFLMQAAHPPEPWRAATDGGADADASAHRLDPGEERVGTGALSIAVIGPHAARRASVLLVLAACPGYKVREYAGYPPMAAGMPELLEKNYDVILLDIDSDPEYALDLVERVGSRGAATVMVYSGHEDMDLVVRSMRAGAREFLTVPLSPAVMVEALVRAAARRPVVHEEKKTSGQLMVFMGSKGGAGATTLACNFAVALARESGEKTLLIDLDLPLGDAALTLGIVPEFSTVDALQAAERLDGSLLTRLAAQHDSGLAVLAAPGRVLPCAADKEAVERLLMVARQEFEHVIVDIGSRLDWTESALLREATAVYLVTQAGISELRNANRLIAQFFTGDRPRLETVINRFDPRAVDIAEEHITRALTRPAQWKIPSDFGAVRAMQLESTPLVLSDKPIARQIRQMAQAVIGQPAEESRKKGFRLFR